MALEAIPKQRISEAVLQQMKSMIARGEWKPGDKIPAEPVLAEMFGVSRLSVRDALQQLTSMGIVERKQGRGTFVRSFDGSQLVNEMLPMLMLDDTEMETMFEFRGMLECESSRLAALRASDEAIAGLRALNDQLDQLEMDPQREAECDYAFHLTIVKATGNKLLIQLYTLLREIIINSLITVKTKIGSKPGLQYHRLLVEAIAAHDQQAARDIMWKHMNSSLKAYETKQDR